MSNSPIINAGQIGADRTYTQVFGDEFDTDGPGPGPHWGYDTMTRALNRTGNSGQDEFGNIAPGDSVEGKRWSAWYNGNSDEFVYRQDGILYFGGRVEETPDPTRENYTFNGIDYDWGDNRFSTAYLVHWHRIYSNDAGKHISDPAYPEIYFGPGHFVECRISVELMRTRGFRCSLWLMPYGDNADKAYDPITENGVEVDIFEIENHIRGNLYGNNRVQSKVLGGDSGKTTDQDGGNVDLSHLNINQGFHTFGLLWLETGLYWFCDGQMYILDEDNVPLIYQFLSLTREINAGVKKADEADANDIPSNGLKRPADVGLYNISVFEDKDLIAQDKAQIDYVRVWKVDGEDSFFSGPEFDGDSQPPTNNVEGESGLIYSHGLVGGVHEYTLVDTSYTDKGVFDWSSYGTDATLISGERGPTLRLLVEESALDVDREVFFIPDTVDYTITHTPIVFT